MFAVIEFKEADGGGLSLVNSQWLTPRKQEVFWPPIKNSSNFSKVLRRVEQDIDPDKWKLFGVEKVFYETEDFDKAKEKLRQAEVTSDLHTDLDEDPEEKRRLKRKIIKKKVFSDTDDDENENDCSPPKKLTTKKKLDLNLPRPPRIQLKLNNNYYTQKTGLSQNTAEEEEEASQIESDVDDGGDTSMNISEQNYRVRLSTPKSSTSTGHSSVVHDVSQRSTPCTDPSSVDFDNNLRDMPAFKTLLENVLKVKAQNRQILSILKKSTPTQIVGLPESLPVNLPVSELEDLAKLESFLEEEEHLCHFKSYCLSI
ncbi:unnamed protein product [Ceutorhynchus assimilis]|nr:unnamed protein product [Ceutorhynchus assimilis]